MSVACGDLVDHVDHLLYRRRRPGDEVAHRRLGPSGQLAHLRPQPLGLQRLAHGHDQLGELQRLRQVVEGAELERLDGAGHVRVGRRDHDQRIEPAFARLAGHHLQHRDAVGVGQVAVENHEVARLALPRGQARLARRRGRDDEALGASASSATMRNVFSSSMTSTLGFMRGASVAHGRASIAPPAGSRSRNSAPPSAGDVSPRWCRRAPR